MATEAETRLFYAPKQIVSISIGVVESVYNEKYGAPRQGSSTPASKGRIKLNAERVPPGSLQDLESFSHLWILWQFHLDARTQDSEHLTDTVRKMPIDTNESNVTQMLSGECSSN
mmetsp:Transcript_53668/g.117142  ORF Transcript_53668/g.117142 Transcript_53668/m.117142 type:complete len:115 (+) Transcript_53668:519-863(+)